MPNPSELPKTFCPAKWDELILNYQHNYVYSCCKATPLVFEQSYMDIITQQRQNLLNGIQDQSCNYCWAVENNNKPSLRNDYLKKFNRKEFPMYLNLNKPAKSVEINLGNTCNMQCIYCNPKFSSQWEDDVRLKKYPVFTDRFNYTIAGKKDIRDTMVCNQELLKEQNPASVVMIGGEPLLNKNFWTISNSLKNTKLSVTSNLNCNLDTIKKLIDLEVNNNLELNLTVSIDCTFPLVTFIRHGLDYNKFLENLYYFIANSKNSKVIITSLMTAITVLDIKNFTIFLESLQEKFPIKNLINQFNVCTSPKIQSFSTIPDITRQEILYNIKSYDGKIKLQGIDSVISYLESTEFDLGLHKQLKLFINEWEARKKVTLDKHFKEKLCL